MYKNLNITKPSKLEINTYLKKWDSLENYVLQESSLRKLFSKTYPKNSNLDDVLIKVCSLNDFYSTHILSPFTIAKHIVSLNIDKNLMDGDLNIVNKIGKVRMGDGITRNFYSFATKYCSHHKPLIYPIYDSYVDKMLYYFRKKDKFFDFSKEDIRNYACYHNILVKFREFYNLKEFSLKEIDKYLWQVGKKYFPKKYYGE